MGQERDETLAMIRRCYEHQHPEDYGREEIPAQPVLYGPGDSATGFSAYPMNEWCQACEINHGVPWSILAP